VGFVFRPAALEAIHRTYSVGVKDDPISRRAQNGCMLHLLPECASSVSWPRQTGRKRFRQFDIEFLRR